MIYLDSDNLFNLTGLTNEETGAYVNDATVNGSVLSVVDGSTLATFSFAYVAASSGDYQGTLTAAQVEANCTAGTSYLVRVVGTEGGSTFTTQEKHLAGYRGFN